MADPETWTIDTFHQLLKRGAFTTIDVWPWVYDCILHASLPLYHPIATLIREYVNSIFTFPNITRIPEDKISPLFSGDVTAPITPPQVLMLLYVVCYNEGVLGARSAEAKLGSSATGHREGRKHEYPTSLIERIPVRRILTHAETHGGGAPYNAVYPDLLALCASHCPELFDVTSFLVEEGRAEEEEWLASASRRKTGKTSIDIPGEVLTEFIEHPVQAVHVLNRLAKEDPVDVAPHAHRIVSAILPRALDLTTDPTVLESFVSVWELLNSVIPRELWTITANLLRTGQGETQTARTYQELVMDPLLLFEVDVRLFRSPILFRLFLQMIECFRVAAKFKVWRRFYMVFVQSQHIFNNNNVMALVLGQDTAMLQCLLEYCKSRDEDKEKPEVLAHIRSLVCAYLHQLCLEDTLIMKLLHFQTYPRELIPVVVEEVPSIHVCFEFLKELIRQPQGEKQVFGIELACRLCDKYPMENYLELAKSILLRWLQKLAESLHAAKNYAAGLQNNMALDAPSPPISLPVTEHVLDAIPLYQILVRAFPTLGELVLATFGDIRREVPQRQQLLLSLEEGLWNHNARMQLRLLDVLDTTTTGVQAEIERDRRGLVNKSVM